MADLLVGQPVYAPAEQHKAAHWAASHGHLVQLDLCVSTEEERYAALDALSEQLDRSCAPAVIVGWRSDRSTQRGTASNQYRDWRVAGVVE